MGLLFQRMAERRFSLVNLPNKVCQVVELNDEKTCQNPISGTRLLDWEINLNFVAASASKPVLIPAPTPAYVCNVHAGRTPNPQTLDEN